jgi:N-acetylglutamate synthase/N-acetylornithine aminotransferase
MMKLLQQASRQVKASQTGDAMLAAQMASMLAFMVPDKKRVARPKGQGSHQPCQP